MKAWIVFSLMDCILLTLYVLLRIGQVVRTTFNKKRNLTA